MKSTKILKPRIATAAIALAVAVLAYASTQSPAVEESATPAGQAPSARSVGQLALQRELADAALLPKLEAAVGDAFGGLWYESSPAQLHVGVTSSASRRRAEAVAADAGLAAGVVATPVEASWAQLVGAQERWDRRLADLRERAEVKTLLEPQWNRVRVVLGSAVLDARRAELEVEAAQDAVDVSVDVAEHAYFRVRPLTKRCNAFVTKKAFCDPTIVAGVRIERANGSGCTAGPAVVLNKPANAKEMTETFILTAGHCVAAAGLNQPWSAFNRKEVKSEVGTGKQFLNGEYDVGVVRVNQEPAGIWAVKGFTPVNPTVALWEEAEPTPFNVTGQWPPALKGETCFSGQASGTKCGVIKAFGTYGTVKELWEVEKMTAEEGDSGAPFWSKGSASLMEGTLVGDLGAGKNVVFHSLETSFTQLKSYELLIKGEETRHPVKFKAEVSPTTLTGKQHASEKDKMTVDAGAITCNEITYSGEATATETSEVSVTPAYSSCSAFGFAATVDVNGCKYTFWPWEKEGSNFEGGAELTCPEGKKLEVTAPLGCVVTFAPQILPGTVTYTNVGSGATREITVDFDFEDIAYEEHDSDEIPCTGDTELTSNGLLEGAALITATNASKEHKGIWVE